MRDVDANVISLAKSAPQLIKIPGYLHFSKNSKQNHQPRLLINVQDLTSVYKKDNGSNSSAFR